MPKPHKEAKRLAKSIRRRRLFAEQVRIEATAARAESQRLSGDDAAMQSYYADRLDQLADREFETAREEEKAHLEAASRVQQAYAPRPIDPLDAERQARALAVLDERGSGGRIRYMAANFGVGTESDHPGELLKGIEALLDRENMDAPANREGMTYGQRISHAETLFYTKPRF